MSARRSRSPPSAPVTSHLPSCEPPQGPFMRLLEQRTTGQMPPVRPRTQSPQATQRSSHTACSCGMPSMLVLTAGSTSLGANFSAMHWMPMPQAMLSTTGYSATFSAIMSRYSHSHWRMAAVCSHLSSRPSSLALMRSSLARISASFSPPVRHTATQVSQPATSTLSLPSTQGEDLLEGLAFSSDHCAFPSSTVAAGLVRRSRPPAGRRRLPRRREPPRPARRRRCAAGWGRAP